MDRDEILNQIRIATLVQAGDVADADIVTIINQGVLEVGAYARWPFLEASTDISLVDSQQAYSVPADFEYALTLIDDDHDRRLEYIAAPTLFQRTGNDTGNESTQPRYWTVWEDSIRLNPIPSDNDTDRLTLYYYKSPTTLSSGSDVPEWNAAFHWLLVEYGKWRVWHREEYFDEAQNSAGMYFAQLRAMREFYARRSDNYPLIAGDGRMYGVNDPNIPSLYLI